MAKSSFGRAFAAARRAGKKTFSWNGKKYTTELAKTPKTTSVKPKARPDRPKAGDNGTSTGAIPKPKARPTRRGRDDAASSVNPAKVHERFRGKPKAGDNTSSTGAIPKPKDRPARGKLGAPDVPVPKKRPEKSKRVLDTFSGTTSKYMKKDKKKPSGGILDILKNSMPVNPDAPQGLSIRKRKGGGGGW